MKKWFYRQATGKGDNEPLTGWALVVYLLVLAGVCGFFLWQVVI